MTPRRADQDDCETCKFVTFGLHSAPCFYCSDFAEWEPKVCNEYGNYDP